MLTSTGRSSREESSAALAVQRRRGLIPGAARYHACVHRGARAIDTQAMRLSVAQQSALAAFGARRDFASGDCIIRRGESGHTMFMIAGGTVRLVFTEEMDAKRLGPGDYFGELAIFLGQHARSASAIADGAVTAWELGPEAIDHLQHESPALFVALVRTSFDYLLRTEQTLIERLRRRNSSLQQALTRIDELHQELDRSQHMARIDDLTGLFNRRGLYACLDELLPLARAGAIAPGLLLVDLDGFKRLNDRSGHAAGDVVLRSVSATLTAGVARGDVVARLGGDEFAVIFTHGAILSDHPAIERLCDALHAADGPCVAQGVSASLGFAGYAPPHDWIDWYQAADMELYRAKESGGRALAANGEALRRCS